MANTERDLDRQAADAGELRKRRRERRVAVFISIAFVLSTIIQAIITNRKEAYGFVQSLLYFGLVHLNVILIMFLVFLVSRNLIKAYLVRRAGKLGSSLRWKMVTSLLAFSLLPSILLFAGSSYVIRQGFDRWFSGQVSRALEDAQAISDVHYSGLQANLEFFADKIRKKWTSGGKSIAADDLKDSLNDYPLQSIELYCDLAQAPLRSVSRDVPDWAVPRAALESLQRAFGGSAFHLIRQFGDGDLVQRFLPLKLRAHEKSRTADALDVVSTEKNCVLILSQTVPLGLKTRIFDLRTAFSGYRQTVLFKESLKTTYTLILLTLFVLILFVVSWFGLYIARSVTEPVLDLMRATEAFREGDWSYRIVNALAPEKAPLNTGIGADLEVLKTAFNTMAEEVGRRGRKLEEANVRLTTLVRELEERERYLEILLSSIRRGVLVLDPSGRIQRLNSEALEFSSVAGVAGFVDAIGKDWKTIFESLANHEDARNWLDEARSLNGRPLDRIFEIRVGPNGAAELRTLRATGISLIDDSGDSIGWLLILEDVSDAARLEKLAAWQEVAKRVAHEIKNPLTPIQISADRLMRRLGERMTEDADDGPVFHECVGQIQKQVRVIRDLVREFSQFAKLPEPKFRDTDLLALCEQILNDYRFTHPHVDFKVFHKQRPDIAGEFWVRADPEYLRRLIVNLADNALHSMEDPKVADPYFHVTLGPVPGMDTFIQVVFEDNGPGIASTLREKIFDPYVTSKASGLGLGLPIVRRIAIEHGGRMRCEESQLGARFVLELPRLKSKDGAH